MIRFDVNEVGLQQDAVGGKRIKQEAVLFLSIKCLFPKVRDHKNNFL